MNSADLSPENNPERVRRLEKLGYVILPGLLDIEEVEALKGDVNEVIAREGDSAGIEFKKEAGSIRLANLVNKGKRFRDLIVHPVILEWVSLVLGERFKLSSLNARIALPHNNIDQPLHCDMGALPDEKGFSVCNTIWMLDPFTHENGPTRVVPGSHRCGKLPQESLEDAQASHSEQVLLTAPAGSVAILNAHTWHGGMRNNSCHPRSALHSFYVRWDMPQQQFQESLLSHNTQSLLNSTQKKILALGDPINRKLSQNPTKTSGFLK